MKRAVPGGPTIPGEVQRYSTEIWTGGCRSRVHLYTGSTVQYRDIVQRYGQEDVDLGYTYTQVVQYSTAQRYSTDIWTGGCRSRVHLYTGSTVQYSTEI